MFRTENNYFESENKNSVFYSPTRVRVDFLKKVYGILAVQLSFTTLFCAILNISPHLFGSFLFNGFLLNLCGFGSIGLIIGLHFKRKEHPTNLILLGLFTFCETILVGHLTLIYDAQIVLLALVLTVVTVATLTLYTFKANRDFSKLRAFSYTALNAIIIGSLIQIFLKSALLDFGFTLLGIAVFAAFIIHDTDNIMRQLSPEEYVVGVINLYLDIINLFVKILKLLQKIQNSREQSQRGREKKRQSN